MKLPRRTFLHLAAGAAALPAVSRIAKADAYPSRPVHITVGFPAGSSGLDTIARLIGQRLSDQLGQPFIIDNRPGAGSNIATEAVVQASPDGYTLLLATVSNAINATLYDDLTFNFIRDMAPVAAVSATPFILVVNPLFPAKTVSEFVTYAKSNPGKVNMASNGNGSAPHIFGELFKEMAHVDLVHVPYRSSFLPDLLSGQVQVAFMAAPAAMGNIQAGRLRALGVTTGARVALLPDIPALGEFVSGYEASSWNGICAPKNTPADIIDKFNKETNAGLADPNFKDRLVGLGLALMPMTTAEFGKLIVDDIEKWGRVIRVAHIKPD